MTTETDASTTIVEEAAAPAAPAMPPCKLFVSYAYIRKEDKQERHGRAFIAGVVDFFVQDQIEQVEQMIGQSLNGLADTVTILNWKRLVS